jgi:GDP-L-fucose synthase
MLDRSKKIYVAGHAGLIGSAIIRYLQQNSFEQIITAPHSSVDLTNSHEVRDFFSYHMPEYVILAAGRVGGIIENIKFPADFLTSNLEIQLNVISAAHRSRVKKLILFGSSCMYPRICTQPMAEEALLTGQPELTSLPYAISKLAGVHLCNAYNKQYGETRFIPVIPNSAYGPNDDFDPSSGHVLSSLIHRFHHAKRQNVSQITLWGSGNPRREFVFSDDIANACIHLLGCDVDLANLPINIGSGIDYSICELASMISTLVGYSGEILWDPSKPDGAPRKLLDSKRMQSLGWRSRTNIMDGLLKTYEWYLDNCALERVQ